jgi:hypothetical protein
MPDSLTSTLPARSSALWHAQELAITTKGGRQPIRPIRQTIDGHGRPEIVVFVLSAGSGSYGQVVATSVIPGSALSPITLPELSGPLVENCLVRRFPIDASGDSNAKPTGDERQIGYKLQAGEAGWILRPTSVLKF